jgi:hypothetical protein
MIKTLFNLLLAVVVGVPASAWSDSTIPNVNLQVTVQQKQEGKLAKGFHVLELTCWQGDCSLSTVSLNQCFKSGLDKKAFFPKVQYSSTSLGNLKVNNEGKSLFVQETGSDMFGDYTTNLRFDYEAVGKGEIINHLIGFSGGYIKNSSLLKKVLTTEYIPLPKRNQVMKLDCDALLPGVDRGQ